MTDPDEEAFCTAFALIEATAEGRHSDAKILITEASLDTLQALAMVSTLVLMHSQQFTGIEPTQVTKELRERLLKVSVN